MSIEKASYHLNLAQHHLNVAGHMLNVLYPMLQEKRMLIKIIKELSKGVDNLIKSSLYYDAYFRRIKISKNPRENYGLFIEWVAPRYFLKNDINNISNVLKIEQKHVEAEVDFVRGNKFVIMAGEKYEILDEFLVRRLFNSVEKCVDIFLGNLRKV